MMPFDPALDRLRRFRAGMPEDAVIDVRSGLTATDLDAILAVVEAPPVADVPFDAPLDPPHWLRAVGRVSVVVVIVLLCFAAWRYAPG